MQTCNQSAALVREIGAFEISEGQPVSDLVKVEEIFLWDVNAAEMAHRHLLRHLTSDADNSIYRSRVKPLLRKVKGRIKRHIQKGRSIERGPDWPEKQVVLCLAFSERMYRDVCAPVIERMAKLEDIEIVVLGSAPFRKSELPQAGNIHYMTLGQFMEPRFWVQEAKWWKKIEETKSKYFSDENIRKIFHSFGVLTLNQYRSFFSTLFSNVYRESIIVSLIASHVIQTHRPKTLICPDTSDSRVRCFVSSAKNYGIPVLDIQHGITSDEAVEWQFNNSDAVAVWGQTSFEALVRHGVPKEKLWITGTARHDFFSGRNTSTRQTPAEASSRELNVLMASTFHDPDHNCFYRPGVLEEMKVAVFEAVHQLDGIRLVVKPHPHENVAQTKKLIGHLTNIELVDASVDIRHLILECDMFVTFGSTATMDALKLGKPILCPSFDGWQFSDYFEASGACLMAKSAQEIKNILIEYKCDSSLLVDRRQDSSRQKFLNSMVAFDGAEAADKILGVLIELPELLSGGATSEKDNR